MSFLQPFLLLALPLAALPVIIHLIHLYRRRRVKWAAMMFLHMAQQMNKGLSRLRQVLILALRVLAILTIIFVIARPLAGGWLGLLGGAPDTVLILVDRSASMSQQSAAGGQSKLTVGLRNLAKAITDAVGTRSRLVLIDSATGKALPLDKASALTNLPQTESTDTTSDIPGLLQAALDYITTNKTGRTDVWLLSDWQAADWDASSGRWQTLRDSFAALRGVRFHLLCYPEPAPDDIGVTVDRVTRRESADKAELVLDIRLMRHVANPQAVDIPLRFVVNGTATTTKISLKENQAALQGYRIPIDKSLKHGWGRVELPPDSFPANDTFHFAFDEPPPLHSVIVSDDDAVSGPIAAALSAATDPSVKYTATILPSSRAAEIPWDDTALIVWDAPLPKPDDALSKQLKAHVDNGRAIVFLPTPNPDDTRIFGLGWARWSDGTKDKPLTANWWRNDDDLLANTRDGAALPVGTLEIARACAIVGEGVPLAKNAATGPLLMRSLERNGGVYFLGTLPDSGSSSLARDGVVLFALLHRALDQGAGTLGKAQQRMASAGVLGADPSKWQSVETDGHAGLVENRPFTAGVYALGDKLIALNRPPGEDVPQTLSSAAVNELFAGLDFHVVSDTVSSGRSLTNEIWRTFLLLMAATIVGEALLCLPPKREVTAPSPFGSTSGPAAP